MDATVGLNLNIFSSEVIIQKLQRGYPARLFILNMYSLTLGHLCSHYPNSKEKYQMHRYLSQLSPQATGIRSVEHFRKATEWT